MSTPATPTVPRYGAPIDLALALEVTAAARAECEKRGWPMVIAIVDSGCNLVSLQRMDQTQLGSIAVAQRKAETALNFRRPSAAFETALAEGGVQLRLVTMEGVTAVSGGLPLVKDGLIVGAIGISGMQSSQDAEIAAIGAAAIG